jgi:succinate dehydrogenase / fumarate reductase cytochrome b subunit
MRKIIFLNADTPNAQGEPYIYKCGFHTFIFLAPLGLFLTFHLLVNLSILAGPGVYQNAVETIHWLETIDLLVPVEVMVVLIPLLSHVIWGFLVSKKNWFRFFKHPYALGVLYPWQRITGLFAFFFVFFHLWQLHRVGKLFAGGHFDRNADLSFAAAQTLSDAITASSISIGILFVGVATGVFHVVNGVRLAWLNKEDRTPRAERKINNFASVAGLCLGLIGIISLYVFVNLDMA